MDRASRPEGAVSDIQEGWDVYDADEQKIGNVDRVEQGYVVAHKGMFFPKDLYIPSSAIERIEHDRVYLHVAKGDADTQGWDAPPTTAAAGAPPPKPDAVGTPGLTGTAEEGGRPVRASGGDTTTSAGRGADAAAGTAASAEATAPTAGTARGAGPVGTTDGDQTLHLHEEELRVSKERVQTGKVRLGKDVVEEEKTLSVPVTREEVFVERTPGDRQPDDHTIEDSADETIRVPVTEERVAVEKVPVETEAVRIGKRQVQETQQVSDTVRREEARIDQTGNIAVAGAGAGAATGWDAAAARFRSGWQQRSGEQGGRWEDVEPSYRYGWQMANDPRYRGRSWADAEPALREDWARAHPETPWERAGAAIREAWDSVTNRT